MQILIQAIPERINYIKPVADYLGATIHIDVDHTGTFSSFRDMLKYETGDYRLHLQDDVIIADRFKDYLPTIESMMKINRIDVFSLFVPHRQIMRDYFNKGYNIAPFKDFLMLQATVFSRRFIQIMREDIPYSKQIRHDDVFVRDTLKRNQIRAFVHLPGLVQHDLTLKSGMGHPANDRRMSLLFDKDFIVNYFNSRMK